MIKGSHRHYYKGRSQSSGCARSKEDGTNRTPASMEHVVCHCHKCISPSEKDTAACIYGCTQRQLLECCSFDGVATLQCGHELAVMSAACKGPVQPGMPVIKGRLGSQEVSVLRDSGCSGVVVRRDLVLQENMTRVYKHCVLIDGTVRKCPTARVFIDSPYFVGCIEALCMSRPVYDVILGNVEGARASDDPDLDWQAVDSKQSDETETTHIEQTTAIQTRAQVQRDQ